MSPRALPVAVVVVVAFATVAGFVPASAESTDADGTLSTDTAVDPNVARATSGTGAAQVDDADRDLSSGSEFWSGWGLRFDASQIIDGGEGTFEIWSVADDGRLSNRVRSFTVGDDGAAMVDTAGLSGRFIVRYQGDPVYVEGGTGYVGSTPQGTGVSIENSAWTATRQTLSFGWSDPTVYAGQRTTLDVSSNRASSVAAVSGPGLDFENLTDAFPASTFAADHDARADQDVLLVDLGATNRFDLDTGPFENGTQELRFDVVDTAANETARLAVKEPASDARIESIDRRESVGDVVEAEVACSQCHVVVGRPDQGVLDVVELRDTNGDDNVTLRINTRYAGMDSSAPGYPSGAEAYTSPEDSVDRYHPGAPLEQVEQELSYHIVRLNELREQQDLTPSGRVRPLGPGTLDVTVAESDFLIDRSAYGDREPLGGQLVIRDEADAKTVTLEPRALDGVEAMGAPDESAPAQTAGRLGEIAAPRERATLGDDLVFRVDAPGVFGYLGVHGVSLETLRGNDDEGIDLSLHRVDDNGAARERVRLGELSTRYLADPANDHLYVVVETGGEGPSRLDAGTYRVTFTLEGVDGQFGGYSTQGRHVGYPYLSPGASDTVQDTVTLAAPAADITSPSEGSSPRLTADGALEVNGTSTVAPSATLRITAASTEYSWETSSSVTVDGAGEWAGELALEDAPGDTFDVIVDRDDERLASATYTVRPPAGNATGEDGGADGGSGSSGGSGGAGPVGGVGLPIPGLSGITGLAVPVGSGVGIVVAVWAAWRLVIRRILV